MWPLEEELGHAARGIGQSGECYTSRRARRARCGCSAYQQVAVPERVIARRRPAPASSCTYERGGLRSVGLMGCSGRVASSADQ